MWYIRDFVTPNEFLLQKQESMETSEIIRSYKGGNSVSEVASMYGISTRKVRGVLSLNKVAMRSHKEASYIKNNRSGDPFNILSDLTPEEEHLKAMSLGLYLTEGNTKNKNSVRFSNSNPALAKIFVKFLKVVCGVENDKIKMSLIVYPDISRKKAMDYWAKFLGLPATQFTKTTILKNRNGGSTKRHSEFGTITIYVHNTKLLGIIKGWAREYAHVAQLVEHIHGKDEVTGSNPVMGSAVSGT